MRWFTYYNLKVELLTDLYPYLYNVWRYHPCILFYLTHKWPQCTGLDQTEARSLEVYLESAMWMLGPNHLVHLLLPAISGLKVDQLGLEPTPFVLQHHKCEAVQLGHSTGLQFPGFKGRWKSFKPPHRICDWAVCCPQSPPAQSCADTDRWSLNAGTFLHTLLSSEVQHTAPLQNRILWAFSFLFSF